MPGRETLHGLGRLSSADGDPAAALTHHQDALTIATAVTQPRDQTRSHEGIAAAYELLGQPALAREHWQQALRIYVEHRLSESHEVEARLLALR